MTRGKAEAIGVLADVILTLGGTAHPDLDALDALAQLLKPSPNAMAHGACEMAERQILDHRLAMTQLDVLCQSLRSIMGDNGQSP